MEDKQLLEHSPQLFHVTEAGAWQFVMKHGLLSTSALLDLYRVDAQTRAQIESQPRRADVVLDDPALGRAVVRDNRPLRVDILDRCLESGSVADWCRLLNSRVFFWATEKRLANHLRARGHRGRAREVIVVDTARLLGRDRRLVTLCSFNSGSTLYPNAPRRGLTTFQAVDAYPFEQLRAKRGPGDAVAEVCVDRAVIDVPEVAKWVWAIDQHGRRRTIWPAASDSP